MTDMDKKPPQVCILAYDGLCSFEFGICVEIFAKERPELDVDWYDCKVVAEQPGPMAMEGGLSVQVPHGLDHISRADLILIPGWRGVDVPISNPLADLLREAFARGATIASICSGAFVLAEAGLLQDKRATTHWRYVEAFESKYPAIELDPDVLYVDEGQVLTSAGSAAGLDLCLHLVRRDFGVQVANSVARRLVLPAHREGGQVQFISRPVAKHRHADISALMDEVRETLDQDWAISQFAEKVGMSRRTLIRRFKDATGKSPLAWLTAERVAYAKELLESTKLSINEIADQTGLGTPETLRHHFRKNVGVSPMSYRASFGMGT